MMLVQAVGNWGQLSSELDVSCLLIRPPKVTEHATPDTPRITTGEDAFTQEHLWFGGGVSGVEYRFNARDQKYSVRANSRQPIEERIS